MVISTCVVLGLSVASQRYRGLIEFSSLQRSLKGRDYRPPLAACGMAAANTEVEPNLNPPSPAWKLRALFMYLLGASGSRNTCQVWARSTGALLVIPQRLFYGCKYKVILWNKNSQGEARHLPVLPQPGPGGAALDE